MKLVSRFLKNLKLICLSLSLFLCCASAQAQSSSFCNDKAFYADIMTASTHVVAGKRILLLSGGVDGDSASRVKNAIQRKNNYTEVWLCSSGGFVHEGKEIGRTLSAAKATVRIPNGFRCVSACTILSLGGFVRIVDPDSQFIVHAASSFLSLEQARTLFFDCRKQSSQRLCELILSSIKPNKYCRSVDDIEDSESDCYVYDPNILSQRKGIIVLSMRYLANYTPNSEFLKLLTMNSTTKRIESTFDLLKYYQEMLLTGRKSLINSTSYRNLQRSFVPVGLYDPTNMGADARNVSDDISAMRNSKYVSDTLSIWQSIFTDVELNVSRQIISHIKAENISLGPAGNDALKVMEAMFICQIQTLCRLTQDEAMALGIHNVFGTE